jgi:hypothetical protein
MYMLTDVSLIVLLSPNATNRTDMHSKLLFCLQFILCYTLYFVTFWEVFFRNLFWFTRKLLIYNKVLWFLSELYINLRKEQSNCNSFGNVTEQVNTAATLYTCIRACSTEISAILPDVFPSIPQSLQANSGITPRLNHNHFHSNPF